MSNTTALPNRRSIRLKGYDYSSEGLYFVTLCVQDRVCLFGNIVDGKMILNDFGQIAERELIKTTEIRQNVEIDSFVIMPNHIHFIVHITRDNARRGEFHSPDLEKVMGEFNSPQPIGEIILLNPEGEFNSPVRFDENGKIRDGECDTMNKMGEFNSNIQMGECNSPLRGQRERWVRLFGVINRP